MTDAPGVLNLAGWLERSRANGPGERFVVWVQGCTIGCPGCFNPETHAAEPNRLIGPIDLARAVLRVPGIEGVTFSGGEPFQQPGPLAELAETVRSAGLTVVCFSGYTLEYLVARTDPAVGRLLRAIDLLIDGPFVREQAAPLRWRGSRNQRVHFLTPTYRHLADQPAGPAVVEVSVGRELLLTGVWPDGFADRLAAVLKQE